MNSPKQKTPKSGDKQPPAKPPVDGSQADEQNQATSEDFEEEGMGVAPKE